jgi:hypothetical protein
MKRATMVLGTILFTIILAMMPQISAIEYQQVKENQEIIIEEIRTEYGNTFKSFLKEGIFDDPDGPYEGGFDDITDFLYLILFLITFPISIPLRIVDEILIYIIGLFWVILNIIAFIFDEEIPEFEYGLLFHLILFPYNCELEWKDEFDWDGDGR